MFVSTPLRLSRYYACVDSRLPPLVPRLLANQRHHSDSGLKLERKTIHVHGLKEHIKLGGLEMREEHYFSEGCLQQSHLVLQGDPQGNATGKAREREDTELQVMYFRRVVLSRNVVGVNNFKGIVTRATELQS
jgi:hypothetical protein